MSADPLLIRLDSEDNHYQPGEVLSGTYELTDGEAAHPQTVEISVYWHTEGKGDEDLGTVHFERRTGEQGNLPEPAGVFQVPLPASPLSYDGVLVKIIWCVRVRMKWVEGRQEVGAAEFRLGNVAPVEEVPG
jgi:hypothetical protein